MQKRKMLQETRGEVEIWETEKVSKIKGCEFPRLHCIRRM